MTPLRLLITLLAGLVFNAILTPLLIRLAHRNRWYDEQNHRKIHTEDTPRIGGVGIYFGFLVSAIVAIHLGTLQGAIGPLGQTPTFGALLIYFLPLIGGMTLIYILGLVDDFHDLRAVMKLFIQIAAAAIVTIGPFRIERLTIPFVWYQLELGLFSFPVTVLWIVAISNALNFIDGVDGLAGGTAAIATLFFGAIALLTGQPVVGLVTVGLFGTIVGFLIYNAPPARIFMGDSGSYVLGFILSVFPLILANGTGTSLNLIPAITILAIPTLDMTTSVVRRLGRGKHPFSADREHLHHKMMDLGFGTWQILATTYSACILLGLVGVSWYLLEINLAMTVTLLVWVALCVLMIVMTRELHRHSGTR
ncbi:MAG: MraY family glycosyltransferase [Spirochaetota bacterium]